MFSMRMNLARVDPASKGKVVLLHSFVSACGSWKVGCHCIPTPIWSGSYFPTRTKVIHVGNNRNSVRQTCFRLIFDSFSSRIVQNCLELSRFFLFFGKERSGIAQSTHTHSDGRSDRCQASLCLKKYVWVGLSWFSELFWPELSRIVQNCRENLVYGLWRGCGDREMLYQPGIITERMIDCYSNDLTGLHEFPDPIPVLFCPELSGIVEFCQESQLLRTIWFRWSCGTLSVENHH